MKLVFTPNPYIHKELVVGYEAGILGELLFERQVPFDTDSNIWKYNPVGKITALELDDGTSIFGGLIVCEYLDSLNTGHRLFPQDQARWRALRLMMLGDGLFNANAALRVELWRDSGDRRMDFMLRERRKIFSALDALEREVHDFGKHMFHIGHTCVAGALSYIDLRNTVLQLVLQPGDEEFAWRDGRPKVADWYDEILERPSLKFKASDLMASPTAQRQLADQDDLEWERNGTSIGPGLA